MTKHNIKFRDVPASDESTQKALNYSIGTSIFIILSSIPVVGEVFDAIQAAGMVIDIIDPYDFNNSLTRSGLDGIANDIITTITQTLNDPTFRKKLFDQMCAQYKCTDSSPKVTPAMINKTIDKFVAYWKEYKPIVEKGCYGDYDASGTLSGTPTNTCNSVYSQSYTNYYNKYHDQYQNGDYSAEKLLLGVLVKAKVNKFRNGVFIISGVVWVIFFLIIFFIIVFK